MISVETHIHLPDHLSSSIPERSYHNDPVSDHAIASDVSRVLKEVSSPYHTLGDSFFAMGIQSYQWHDGEYKGAGPLADLYPVEQRTVCCSESLRKVGFHNQNIEKPSWEIHKDGQHIELLAASATPVKGAGEHDVPWLYVELEDNDHGYGAIVRSHTRGGIAPAYHMNHSARIGVGYMTLYTLIHSDNGYTECGE